MNDTFLGRIGSKFSKAFKAMKTFAAEYDIESWPAFVMFLFVVTLGVSLTFIGMRKAFGDFPAALIAGLFEAGIVAWKWQGARRKNNEYQNSITVWATWISVGLASCMLIANLFRVSLQSKQVSVVGDVTLSRWEIVAYLIIGLAALVHVVYFLLFDQNDTEKQNKRTNANEVMRLEQRDKESDNALANLETDTKILRKIIFKLKEVQDANIDLPVEQLEPLLEKYRQNLLKTYNASHNVDEMTKKIPDVNHDGFVGKGKTQAIQARPRLASAAEVKQERLNGDDRPTDGQ